MTEREQKTKNLPSEGEEYLRRLEALRRKLTLKFSSNLSSFRYPTGRISKGTQIGLQVENTCKDYEERKTFESLLGNE